MAAFTKHQAFVEHMAEKVHNLGADAITAYLTTNANAPSASADAVLTDVVEIAYTNLSSRVFSITTSAQSAGTYTWLLADLTLTASGAVATFRWAGIYNDTPSSGIIDPLICFYDYGSDVTLASGETFTYDFTTSTFTLA